MVPLPQEGGWGTVRVKLPREGVPGKRHKKGAAPGRKPRRKGQLLLLRARNKTIHVTELHSFQNIFTQKRRKRLTGLSKRNTILYCISMHNREAMSGGYGLPTTLYNALGCLAMGSSLRSAHCCIYPVQGFRQVRGDGIHGYRPRRARGS